MTYIALLRAINVGGHNIKMERLRELFSQLGFANVRSYIQSGNVFFEADGSADSLRGQIERHLAQHLGYEVPVVLRTLEELAATLAAAPFKTQPADNERYLIVYTNQVLKLTQLPLVSPKGDCQILGSFNKDAYVRWEIINGRPPSDAKFLKDNLGTAGTARFFHTSQKILEAAN